MNEILMDISGSGKVRPWKERKKSNQLVSAVFAVEGFAKKVERMANCGEYLTFSELENSKKERSRKLKRANFCRERLCAMCAWRKALFTASTVQRITETLLSRGKYEFLSLTLTIPNVSGDNLESGVEYLKDSFNKLQRRKIFKKNIAGWYRNTEITKNQNSESKSFGTYHPHIHCLLAVSPSYFTRDYIKRDSWLKMWQECTENPAITQVDIRRITPQKNLDISCFQEGKEKAENINKAVFEFTKYITDFKFLGNIDDLLKAEDLNEKQKKRMRNIHDTIMTLHYAIKGKRLSAFGGIFKEIKKELALKDADDATEKDLILADPGGVQDEWNEIGTTVFRWDFQKMNYFKI